MQPAAAVTTTSAWSPARTKAILGTVATLTCTAILGVGFAALVGAGLWYVGLALLAVIPCIVWFHRYPLAGVAVSCTEVPASKVPVVEEQEVPQETPVGVEPMLPLALWPTQRPPEAQCFALCDLPVCGRDRPDWLDWLALFLGRASAVSVQFAPRALSKLLRAKSTRLARRDRCRH